MKIRITNKVLIPLFAFMVLTFAFVCFFAKEGLGEYTNSQIYVKKANKVVEKIDVSKLKTEKYEINAGTNTICITKDGVYMKDASCPDKLCKKSGKINKPGQSIVCLPNKIMVEIVGVKKDVDAVAGAR